MKNQVKPKISGFLESIFYLLFFTFSAFIWLYWQDHLRYDRKQYGEGHPNPHPNPNQATAARTNPLYMGLLPYQQSYTVPHGAHFDGNPTFKS